MNKLTVKRIILAISFVLWYVVSVLVIFNFVKGILTGQMAKDAVAYFIGYYIATILLVIWSMINTSCYQRLYGDIVFMFRPGGNGILGWILRVIMGPLMLITFLATDLKPAINCIFHNPLE